MNIPNYQSLMLPLLQALADGRRRHVKDVRNSIANKLGLGPDERRTLLPSGKQPIFDNRLGWAMTYLRKAGLVRSIKRGVCQITNRGYSIVALNPAYVGDSCLLKFPKFVEFRRGTRVHPRSSRRHKDVHSSR